MLDEIRQAVQADVGQYDQRVAMMAEAMKANPEPFAQVARFAIKATKGDDATLVLLSHLALLGFMQVSLLATAED